MAIVMFTEGGRNRGFGHLTRCLSLSQALKNYGVPVRFIVNGDSAAHEALGSEDVRWLDWANDREEACRDLSREDGVIIDSYQADEDVYQSIADSVRIGLYVDDNIRLAYPTGIVVNGTIFAENFDYRKQKGSTYLLGTPYIPLRREFWEVPEKIIRDRIAHILVTFGGSDTQGVTARIVRYLLRKYPEARKSVVVGKGVADDDMARLKTHTDANTLFYRDIGAGKMMALMSDADVAVSAAGQTVYELARTGTPAILVKVAENQENNLIGWQKAGFAENAGSVEGSLETRIDRMFQALSDKTERAQRSLRGREQVDGKGAQRIVKEILERMA